MNITHGDCLGENGLKNVSDRSIDMILCDLPYQLTNNKWDKLIPIEELFKQYNRIIKDTGTIVLFSQQPFTTDLINANRKNYKCEIIWDKKMAANFVNAKRMPLKIHENILIFYKKPGTYNPQKVKGKPYLKKTERKDRPSHLNNKNKGLLDDVSNPEGLYHPKSIQSFTKDRGLHTTQKPVALCEWLIKTYTNEGDVVLDNCMGCGTTGVACLNTGREFMGWEMDEEYFNVSKKRLEDTKKELEEKTLTFYGD